MRQQLVVRIFHGKIFLMVPHHGDQHFFRQTPETAVSKSTENHGGKFRQVHDRVEQGLVFPPPRPRNRARGGVQRFANLLLTFRTAQNLGRAQRVDISATRPAES